MDFKIMTNITAHHHPYILYNKISKLPLYGSVNAAQAKFLRLY